MTAPCLTDDELQRLANGHKRFDRERRTGGRSMPRVSLPVDVSDAERFPNIAAAVEWAEHLQREWDESND